MLEQQEAKDEPQRKIDVLYEESKIIRFTSGDLNLIQRDTFQ